MEMSKVGVFFGTGFEEIEALTVVDLLRRVKIEVDMVSVTGEKVVMGSHNIGVNMDMLLAEEDFDALDAIVLPGGLKGTEMLENTEPLMKQVERFFENGKLVCAICAAPTILGHKGILNGKKACCYPGMEEELLEAKVSMDSVSVDGNVITSRGMGTSFDFALAIIEKLLSKEEAVAIAKKVVYLR